MAGEAFKKIMRESYFPKRQDGKLATDAEMMYFLSLCKSYNLDPFTGEIYAFIAQGGGIKPIVSVDGWCRVANEHKQFDGMEFSEVNDDKGNIVSMTIKVYRKDRQHPTVVTEYFKECFRETEPWKKWPRRMLRHKTLRQGFRYAFGFASQYDEDYYEMIPVGEGATQEAIADRIANHTAAKAEGLKEKIKNAQEAKSKSEPAPAQKTEAPKSADAPVVHPSEATQTQGEAASRKKAEPSPAPQPEGPDPEAPIGDKSPEQDVLIGFLLGGLDRRKAPRELAMAAQAAVKAQMVNLGYADPRTQSIKHKDYSAMLKWADDWFKASKWGSESQEEI
jgi:phage recombination protein Bet